MSPSIAMVSTYPPTQCGIATFARSLGNALVTAGGEVDIVGLGSAADKAPGVDHVHRNADDVPRTSRFLNDHDAVILQHEFGIYDGLDGEGVLAILGETAVPVISVLHTVPAAPTARQRHVLQSLLDGSDALVVLSHSADRALRRHYRVRPGSVQVIPHGAPDLGRLRGSAVEPARPRMLTWGLLSRGKGIEWGIHALSLLSDIFPTVEYVIAGCTHPKVREHEGERYRYELMTLAEHLDVADQVRFIDGYLDDESLADLIASSSAYLLAYDSTDQITSGVLTEAMVAGGPVIATPFPHAVELLGNGTGMLVRHRDPRSIAEAFTLVIDDPDRAQEMRSLAAALSQGFLWPNVGEAYICLATDLWRRRPRGSGLTEILYPENAGLLRAIS